jgi:hypothetical protein
MATADIVNSDSAISDELKTVLFKYFKSELEDISLSETDLHPGSDGKVLDLVHPSLAFLFVYDVSPIIPDAIATLEDCIEGPDASGDTRN